jgi:putative DNA primase/helicase
MNFNISVVKNIYDNKPQNFTLTYKQLVKLTTSFSKVVNTKNQAPGFIGGHFSKPIRETEFLISRTIITLDVDNYNSDLTSLEGVFKRDFKDQWYIAYSTSSHTPEKPKIRILILLNKEIKIEDYKQVVLNYVNDLEIRDSLDIDASTKPNQLMLFPFRSHAVTLSHTYKPWFKVQEGDLLDPNYYLLDYPIDWGKHNQSNILNIAKPLKNKIIDKNIDPVLTTLKNQPLQLTLEQIKDTLKLYKAATTDYHTWIEVGMALSHQFEGDNKGLELWYNWSRLDKRYNEADIKKEVKAKWSSFGQLEKPITFATIMKKAQALKIVNFSESQKTKTNIKFNINRDKFLHVIGENKRPLNTIENFRVILNEYNISISSDVILKRKEVTFNKKVEKDLNVAQATLESLCIQNGMPNSSVSKYMEVVKSEVNTWKEWIESKPWDGIDRLSDFYATVKVDEAYEDIKQIYLKIWLMQMIHLSCLNDEDEGKMGRMVLVFQGKQLIGKTSWFKALAPKTHQKYLKEGLQLDTKDSMSVLACIQHVFVELGELGSTFKKSDSDNLKNFISSTSDVVNIKYVANHVIYRRRTVFFASINDQTFLQDTTGNTRYCILPVISCNYAHKIDMQQLYAQLYHNAKNGEGYEMTTENRAIQTTINTEFENPSYLKEKFMSEYDIDSDSRPLTLSTPAILESLGLMPGTIKQSHMSEITKILTDFGYKKRIRTPKGWILPPRRI